MIFQKNKDEEQMTSVVCDSVANLKEHGIVLS